MNLGHLTAIACRRTTDKHKLASHFLDSRRTFAITRVRYRRTTFQPEPPIITVAPASSGSSELLSHHSGDFRVRRFTSTSDFHEPECDDLLGMKSELRPRRRYPKPKAEH